MKFLVSILLSAIIFFSCKKDSLITSSDASLYTSIDTLSFDTVFTNVGSVTGSFKIFNNNDQKLKLSFIRLAGGSASQFKMNVNGTSSTEVDNLEVGKNDSIYIFVQVNVNPSSSILPFILQDSIEISYNGNIKWVQLQAYGQNAIFLKNQLITGNVTWNKNLPYVIFDGIKIDSNAILNIEAGTKIFLHANAPFLVDGTLTVTGTKEQPVTFAGDRLDQDYKDLPAAWPGIYFRSASKNNSLVHTTIKNAYQGIVATGLSDNSNPKVNLSKCILDNIYDAGLLGINTSIFADNSLISNCGSNINLQGGDYRFINCTVASYGSNYISHKAPVLQIYNYVADNSSIPVFSLTALFQNCIFWGDGGTVDNEIFIDKQGTSAFSATFDHVLYKAKDEIAIANFISSIKNEMPIFDSIDVSKNIFDFHFNHHPNSPAVDAGVITPFLYDLDDKMRDSRPDLGCYER